MQHEIAREPGARGDEENGAAWAAAPPPTRLAPREPELRGERAPVPGRGAIAIAEALLRSPASVLHELQHGRGVLSVLAVVVTVSMGTTGVVVGVAGGGWQLLVVPVKLALGMFSCALICLPSLHVLACLSGGSQSVRETWGALLMGVAVTGVLLVGFAPVAWVFSQSTSSPALLGALHLSFLVISSGFGIGLTGRALAAMNGGAVRGASAWGVMFVLVMFQMTTTLRPLVGELDGVLLHERLSFVEHWLGAL